MVGHQVNTVLRSGHKSFGTKLAVEWFISQMTLSVSLHARFVKLQSTKYTRNLFFIMSFFMRLHADLCCESFGANGTLDISLRVHVKNMFFERMKFAESGFALWTAMLAGGVFRG